MKFLIGAILPIANLISFLSDRMFYDTGTPLLNQTNFLNELLKMLMKHLEVTNIKENLQKKFKVIQIYNQ